MINILTLEQEKELENYNKKWQKLIFSTNFINKDLALKTINQAYAFLGYKEPIIIFCSSPYTAFLTILENSFYRLEYGVESYLIRQIWNQIKSQVNQEILRLICQKNKDLKYQINHFKNQVIYQIRKQLHSQSSQRQKKTLMRSGIYIQPDILASYGSQSDFCISILKCDYNSDIWQIFQSLIQNCGWIITLEPLVNNAQDSTRYEKIVIVCERPTKLFLDSKYRLHTNTEEPAIQFPDGYSLYSHHGFTLTEK